MDEFVEWRWVRCDGGCEKAFGWGRNVGELDGRPSAVAFSSSSPSSLSTSTAAVGPTAVCCRGRLLVAGAGCSFELVMILSSSLSVSSYSS